MLKNASKNIKDYKLSRYDCYLIAQNGDSRKKTIDFAQTYFTNQTRKMEIVEKEYFKLNEDELIKNSLKQKNIKTFIDSFNQTAIEVLYRDLCYLGLVQQRVYYKNGFIDITDINDPAYDPNKMNKLMTKIIKW